MKKLVVALIAAIVLAVGGGLAYAHISNVPGIGDVENTILVLQYGLTLPISTVATLPTCSAATKGRMQAVSDATSPTYNGTLTGSGAVVVPVFCNGTAWTSH